MPRLTPEQWKEASPLLDEALTLSEGERADWLAALREKHPETARLVEGLLGEYHAMADERFLEQSPPQPAGDWATSGHVVGAYRLLSPIGHGGMGTVWLAERNDGRFERKVAIKFPNISVRAAGQERFEREGRILGRLAHPNIAELIDAGVSSTGQPYLVLEYVDGEPIDEYCEQQKLGIEGRTRLFLEVLSAVAHAHTNLIVHRDIKPSNVLVTTDGQVKLLDFGIAKLLEDQTQPGEATLLTQQAGAGLTPAYAAPEQITGQPITTATDVYSLGVLFYVLLTAQHPAGVGTRSAADLVKAIVETEPSRPSDAISSADANLVAEKRGTTPEKLRRELRGDLDTIVCKALKKDARERYASVVALADDLVRYCKHETIGARPDSLAYRTRKFVRRNRAVVGLAAVTLLASVAGLVGTLMQARTARQQRDFAYRQLSRAEAVNELNNFLLYDAAPSGKPFTAFELLGRAEQIVDRQYGANPDRLELLIFLGRQYASADQDGKARPLLEQAYTLSRGLAEPSIRSKASCTLADVVSDAGDHERAEALIQQGLRELPQRPEYTLDRVFCLLRGREVASHNGDAQTEIARTKAAQQLLDSSPFRSDSGDLHVIIDLAEAYRDAGQYREAIANFEEASRLMTSLGRDNTENAGVLYNNWALALYQIGRPLEAEAVFLRAINIDRADSTDAAVSSMTLLNYGRTLRELGRLAQAAEYAERAHVKALQLQEHVVVNQSLMEIARIDRQEGELVRAESMLVDVEREFRRDLPPGHYAFAALATERSLISLARGDIQNARRLAEEAVTIDEAAIKSGGQGAGLLPILLFRRSAIELENHQPEVAVSDAERAVKLLQSSTQPGIYSCYLGRAYLILGLAQRDQGQLNQARTSFRIAAEHLQNTLGADHPDTRVARQLLENPGSTELAPPLG